VATGLALAVASTGGVLAADDYVPQAAQRIKVGIGGYHQQWAVGLRQRIDDGPGDIAAVPGARSNTIKTNPIDQKHNAEICFIGQTTLDNGLTIALNVQLEANSETDQIDETYIVLQGPSFGQAIIGDENNAPYLMHVWPPDGGVSLDEGDLCNIDAWVNTGVSYFEAPLCTTNLRMTDNDSGKFSYITPRFAGLQAGLSFIPQAEAGGDDNNGASFVRSGVGSGTQISAARNRYANGWAGGVNYTQPFDGWGVQFQSGALWFPRGKVQPVGRNGSDLLLYNASAQVTVGSFSVGGAYLKAPNKYAVDRNVTNLNGIAGQNATYSSGGWSYALGAAYEFGPYKVGVGYMYGQGYGLVSASGPAAAVNTGNDQSLEQAVVSGTWTMGPGIRLVGGVFAFDLETDTPGVTGYNSKGIGAATGLKLAF
jgi:hypothetical protein